MKAIILLLISFSTLAGPIPDVLKGNWKVTKVIYDPKNTTSHQVPVSKIENTILSFRDDRVTMTDLDCLDPQIQLEKATDGESLKISCTKSAKVVLPNTNAGLWFTEKSAILKKNGELVVTLNADGTYFAKKMTTAEVIKPSFDCSKATTPTEKTICSRVELSNLDLQMSKTYKQASENAKDWGDEGECLKAVKKAHGAWLKKRNECKADFKCLENSMKEQIEVESDQLQSWIPKVCLIG